MAGPSSKKSIEDLENQLLLKNKDLNEKFLELETLLDLTNTINSLDDLDSLFFNVLTLSSSILNSSKGIILIKNDVSNIFDPISTFNIDEEKQAIEIFFPMVSENLAFRVYLVFPNRGGEFQRVKRELLT